HIGKSARQLATASDVTLRRNFGWWNTAGSPRTLRHEPFGGKGYQFPSGLPFKPVPDVIEPHRALLYAVESGVVHHIVKTEVAGRLQALRARLVDSLMHGTLANLLTLCVFHGHPFRLSAAWFASFTLGAFAVTSTG